MTNTRGKTTAILLVTQILFIVLFGLFVDYGTVAGPRLEHSNQSVASDGHSTGSLESVYPMFLDIHVMMLVGFGFLMTFLAYHGFGSVGFNFLLTCYVIEWSILVNGWFGSIGSGSGTISLDVMSFMHADFAVATILISFGAVLGKTSPVQLLIMATIEVVIYNISLYIGVEMFHAVDVGGAIFIHAFGAYFGLSVSRVIYKKAQEESTKEKSVYHSDLFAMIGTVFLWLYWPSFNAGPAAENERHRAVINTILSLCGSTVVTFALSAVINKENKIDMVHVQNATLAGGVMMGASADMILYPYGAMLSGAVAGTVSTLGYKYLQPVLTEKLKLHDTCGVHNLHGMPGILGTIVSAIAAAMATKEVYQGSFGILFPHVASAARTSQQQGGYQIAALAVALALAIVGGALTGFLLKLLPGAFDALTGEENYDDSVFWDAVEEQESDSATPEALRIHKKEKEIYVQEQA